MNFIGNRNFRAGPQTSLEGFICPQNSDKQQKIKVFGRSVGGHLFVTMLLFIGGVLLIACTIANVAPKIPPIEFIFSPRKYLIKKK